MNFLYGGSQSSNSSKKKPKSKSKSKSKSNTEYYTAPESSNSYNRNQKPKPKPKSKSKSRSRSKLKPKPKSKSRSRSKSKSRSRSKSMKITDCTVEDCYNKYHPCYHMSQTKSWCKILKKLEKNSPGLRTFGKNLTHYEPELSMKIIKNVGDLKMEKFMDTIKKMNIYIVLQFDSVEYSENDYMYSHMMGFISNKIDKVNKFVEENINKTKGAEDHYVFEIKGIFSPDGKNHNEYFLRNPTIVKISNAINNPKRKLNPRNLEWVNYINSKNVRFDIKKSFTTMNKDGTIIFKWDKPNVP